MNNLATYNRVRTLAQTPYKNLLSLCYLLFLFIAFISLGNLWLNSGSWSYNKLAIGLSISACILLSLFARRSKQHCRFCGGPLVNIERPFILTPKFLKLNGHKIGQSFYTYKNSSILLGKKQWVKISIHSLACHHCRLTEEKQVEHHEPASTIEVESLTK